MHKLETNDWIILNNVIFKIYTTDNFNKMRKHLLESLKMIIDFDSADFYMASQEEGSLLCNPVTYNCDVDLSSEYEDIDHSRGIVASGKTLIFRVTDIISDEERVETEYYKTVYKPNSWHFALHMVIARHKKFLGAITFYRTIGKENFEHDDIFILDMLKEHIAYRLEKYIKSNDSGMQKCTVSEAVSIYDLTRRESEILRLLMAGKDNTIICQDILITENTLKKHILNIYRKLGINSRVQLFKMVKEYE